MLQYDQMYERKKACTWVSQKVQIVDGKEDHALSYSNFYLCLYSTVVFIYLSRSELENKV